MYGLDIPEQLKNAWVTSVFHPRKLHFARFNPFLEQVLPPDPPAWIKNDEAESPQNCGLPTYKRGLDTKATFVGNWDEKKSSSFSKSFNSAPDKALRSGQLLNLPQLRFLANGGTGTVVSGSILTQVD